MTIKVGIVGAGSMGTVHAASWMRTPAQLMGVHALEWADILSEKHGIKNYDTLEALIADVDVVDVCTPTHEHYGHVMQALKAGKDVICEKPLARHIPQAEEMVQAAKAAGKKLLVGQVVRFFPEYALAKAQADAGAVGELAVLRTRRAGSQPGAGDARNWFLDFDKSGGLIYDLMIHDLDYVRWVAGEVVSVFAKDVRSKEPDARGDYALAILTHESGAISHCESAWAYPPGMFRTALEIAGSEGLIEHPSGSSAPLEMFLHKDESGETPRVAIPKSPLEEDPYTAEIRHFYDVLVNNAEPRVTAEDGLMALKLSAAAQQSAQTGKPVKIEEV